MEHVPLKYPIERIDAEPVTHIVIRRTRLRDVDAMNKAIREAGGTLDAIAAAGTDDSVVSDRDAAAGLAGTVAMIASMNDLDPEVLRDMDLDDFAEVQRRLAGFTPQAPGATHDA